MRHHNANRKFGRETGQRQAFLRSLISSLIVREKIRTTQARAKEIRPLIEKMITRAKNPTLANIRLLSARLGTEDKKVAEKLIKTVAPKYKETQGGYTRITKLPPRKSDGAAMAIIELI